MQAPSQVQGNDHLIPCVPGIQERAEESYSDIYKVSYLSWEPLSKDRIIRTAYVNAGSLIEAITRIAEKAIFMIRHDSGLICQRLTVHEAEAMKLG